MLASAGKSSSLDKYVSTPSPGSLKPSLLPHDHACSGRRSPSLPTCVYEIDPINVQ